MIKFRPIRFIVGAMVVVLGGWTLHRCGYSNGGREAPIEDGKTLDYSSGRLVVKVDPTLKTAEAELNAAAANVTFAPAAKKPVTPK